MMTGKKSLILLIALVGLFFSLTIVSANTVLSEPSFCCERTTSGAYCVNAPEDQCASGYKSSPTSCETTSYCRLGTCYDSGEGICLENTPQSVCEESGGTWDDRDIEQVPQCQLGCCIIGDQASFVSLTRCKRLSTFFGVENNYNPTITNEVQCIATAQAQDMGACVYEEEFERVCEFTTRAECGAEEVVETVDENGTSTSNSNKRTFYEDLHCSAEELSTACARQTATQCYQGKVYWEDSCGNRENVYSEDREQSWNNGRVLEANEVCDPNDGSELGCGNCDYFQGTRCSEWEGTLGIGKPPGSDHLCKRTECTDREGNERKNGESWCVFDSDTGLANDKVGSRYYREVCVDGEVRVEPCADFRNEICIGGNIEVQDGTDFSTAACRVNRWQDCTLQTDEDDCLNNDQRDCLWMPAVTGMVLGGGSANQGTIGFSNPTSGTFTNPTAAPITGNAVVGEGEDAETVSNREDGICVPRYTPGFDFWQSQSAAGTCGQATAECVVIYEKGLFGGRKLVAGEECLQEAWAERSNRVCTALGDCGGYVNYNDQYTDDGYEWFQENYGDDGKREFSPSAVNRIKGGISGFVLDQLKTERDPDEQ